MGKPEFHEFALGTYARGPDVYANDGSILAEVLGNCEKRVNIQSFENVSLISNWFFHDHNSVTGWLQDTYFPIHIAMVAPATITHVSYIGFAPQISNGGFYSTGATWSAGAIAANKLDLKIRIKDEIGNQITNNYAPQEMAHANKETLIASNRKVGAGWTLEVASERPSGANINFKPWVKVNIWMKTEHI